MVLLVPLLEAGVLTHVPDTFRCRFSILPIMKESIIIQNSCVAPPLVNSIMAEMARVECLMVVNCLQRKYNREALSRRVPGDEPLART